MSKFYEHFHAPIFKNKLRRGMGSSSSVTPADLNIKGKVNYLKRGSSDIKLVV
jgi:hypothetical protein